MKWSHHMFIPLAHKEEVAYYNYMNYFTSDTHFGHEPILTFCQRPFLDIRHMGEVLVKNINTIVTPKDTLYLLGDVSFYSKDRTCGIIASINCPVVLIKGNHDHSSRVKGVPYAEVFDELDIQLSNKQIVTLSHFPYYIGDGKDRTETRKDKYLDRRPIDVGLWLLHGHTHSPVRVRRELRMLHVGVDAWNYGPISEEDVIVQLKG